VVAEVPVALVKKILPVVRPPVDEALRNEKLEVLAVVAAKSVAVAFVAVKLVVDAVVAAKRDAVALRKLARTE
jgi:hypothetical protein